MLLSFLLAVLIAVPLSAEGLSAVSVQLHDYEDGPPIPSGQPFRASETVFLTFQISGFQATEDDHIQLAYEISTTDPTQRLVGPVKTGKIEAELAPEDKKKGKQWMPKIRYQIQLPLTPVPGAYRIQIHLDDKINGSKQVEDVPFHVESSAATPAETLTVQNFRFLRSENEKERLPENGSFRPGDVVWARFNIAGYKFGPNNRYEVKYGLSLQNSAGKSMFSNPTAAEDANESFYPRTSVPGEFNLNLDKNIKPGTYTVILSLTDPIGHQSVESTHEFRIE